MIKAVVTDMDGTLLNEKDEIPAETLNYLITLEEKGIHLVLASGRSFNRLEKYVEALQMRKYRGFLIEVNGLAIQDLSAGIRTVFDQIDEKQGKKLFQLIAAEESEIQFNFDDGFYDYIPESMLDVKKADRQRRNLPEDYPWSGGAWAWNADMREGYPKQYRIHSFEEIHFPVNKVTALNDPEISSRVFTLLHEQVGAEFEIVRTCPRLVEMTPKNITKGSALMKLMQKEGWKRDEVVVFGDGENDCSMFEACDFSVAMGNAAPYVKSRARYLALSNIQQGLMAFLKEILV